MNILLLVSIHSVHIIAISDTICSEVVVILITKSATKLVLKDARSPTCSIVRFNDILTLQENNKSAAALREYGMVWYVM
jgi:orotate phosphoribosyltransferase